MDAIFCLFVFIIDLILYLIWIYFSYLDFQSQYLVKKKKNQ